MIPLQQITGQPPQAGSPSQHPPTLQLVVLLLLTICLASLGSFSLAAYFLPGMSPSAQSSSASSHASPTSTSFTGPFSESECTVGPQNMKYLPGGQSTTKMPAAWSRTAHTQSDFANAQACVASFVITYQTFDSDDLKTLETCTTVFTDGARQRFYSKASPDKHMDPMWRASLQKQHYQQVARAALPTLLATSTPNGRFLAWMVISYQTSVQIDNGQPIVQNAQLTVLLVAVPINTQKTGTGWQVSKWLDGNARFDISNPL